MSKLNRFVVLVACFFATNLTLSAQAAPCRPGNLGAVLGTTCSVGPVNFTFGPDFFGFFDDPTTFELIDPTSIGFTPLSTGSQSGFVLTFNYSEVTPGPVGSAHSVQFSYTPEATANAELRSQSVAMDAALTGSPVADGFVIVDDQQTYPNSPFPVDAFASLGLSGPPQFTRLSDTHILEVPAFLSTGSPSGGFTTSISSEAIGSSSAQLTSATFLYGTGPVVPAPPLANLSYKTIDLPGVPETFVSNITNSGRTVGTIEGSDGAFHGYIAEADGVTFATFDFPGATATFGGGLNERGDVVGEYTDAAGHNHGFLRTGRTFSTIDVPDSRFTTAIGINDKGQIVGEFESQDRGFHSFLLDNGNFTIIDHGPGTGLFASSGADSINNSGQIAGFFFDPDTFRGYTQKGNSFQTFDVPGQGDTVLEGINNPGNFVGTFNDINFVQHGFLNVRGSLSLVDFPGGANNFALGVNASGQIVGQFTDADGLSHSYLATAAANDDQGPHQAAVPSFAPTEDCNSEGWQLKHAQRHHLTGCRVGK